MATRVKEEEVWLDEDDNPTYPGAPKATKHLLTYYDDGSIIAKDWMPSQEWWQQGPLAPGQTSTQGTWSAEYTIQQPSQPYSNRGPANEWIPVTDPRTGEIIATQDKKSGYSVNLPKLPEPKVADDPNAVGANWQQDEREDGIWAVNRVTNQTRFIRPYTEYEKSTRAGKIAASRREASGIGLSTPRQPRWAEEEEADRLTNEKTRLDIQKAQKDLKDPYTQALEQQYAVIDTIRKQVASEQITLEEGTRLIELSKSNLQSALQGTTPFQMEQEKNKQKQQQATLAQSVLASQMSTGSSMATGLLSGLGGVYGNILSSSNPSYDFNPLDMAKGFVNDMSGGQDMNALARRILMGSLQGGL